MTEAVRCARCGIRFDGKREKCPKCGDRRRTPVVAATSRPASPRWSWSRRAAAIAASILLLGALGAWSWIASRVTVVASTAARPPSPLAAILSSQERRPVVRVPASRIPTEIPFVDSAAAGRREYDSGNLEQALEHFLAQVSDYPSDAESHSNAGQVLIRLGRTSEAMPYLSKAVALDPGRWAYRFNLARAEGLLGEWDKAAQDYAAATQLFPNDYATLFNLGQALHRAGREQEAVARYREAIQQKPDDSTFYLALGVSEERLGHTAEAAAAYSRFVQMDPTARQTEAVAARAKQLQAASPPARAAASTPRTGQM